MKNLLSCAQKCLIFVITMSVLSCTFLQMSVGASGMGEIADINCKEDLPHKKLCGVATLENAEENKKELSVLKLAKDSAMASNASEVNSESTPDKAMKSMLCGNDGEVIDIPVEIQYYDVGYTLTDEELQLLYYVVDTEVVSGSVEHKMIIAEVIFNRVKSPRFPNTVKGVILAPKQFSTAKGYYSKKNFKPSQKTLTAVSNVLSGKCIDASMGALYFCNPNRVSTNWFEKSLKKLFDMEGHRFYTYKT